MNPAESVSDPECKFSMYDQPPGDIDLVMAIEVQLLIIPMDHTPPMFVTVGAKSYLQGDSWKLIFLNLLFLRM